jgi:hypothetical protein
MQVSLCETLIRVNVVYIDASETLMLEVDAIKSLIKLLFHFQKESETQNQVKPMVCKKC